MTDGPAVAMWEHLGMRIVLGVVVVGMLSVGCADDSDLDAAPVTSVVSITTTSVVSTTAPIAASTVPPSSTTAPSTTTVSPSTTSLAGDPFAEFTSREMAETLAQTHTYIGGSTISPDFEVAVEQWARGSVVLEDWFVTGGEMEVWVLDLLRHTEEGVAVWRRVDVFVVEMGGDLSFAARCRLDGVAVDGLVATTPSALEVDEPWLPALMAWQVDLDELTVAEVDATAVDCENEGFGV